ncbi:hypothetical protein DPMN_136578 [Dreissena polymorpha]|uniref:Peptidase A2 domain-containing protein n=1 Tax=Dreissena polymorpha TaxID=45954 RepID=A0A9D4G050_DREPO|nr:hypothetical protein DPMN_136578 [Dreissena polymorpha]
MVTDDNRAESVRSEERHEEENDKVSVLKLSLNSMFRIPLKLQNIETNAVIDTAAKVTIISDRIYHRLPKPPRVIKKSRLNAAGSAMSMSGFVCGSLAIKLGESEFEENVNVAPIQDDMLLGLDFMRKHNPAKYLPNEK